MTKNELQKMAQELRELGQEILHRYAPSIKLRKQLAKDVGISYSSIHSMIQKGSSGLDTWCRVYGKIYNLNIKQIKQLLENLKAIPLTESDKIWASLKENLNATEDELKLLALCAHETLKIKRKLEKESSN